MGLSRVPGIALRRYAIGFAVVSGTTALLSPSSWDISSSGIVRFGRAAMAVGRVAADYKFSLHGLDPSTENYLQERSKVRTCRKCR